MLWADGICLHIFTLFLPSRTAANKPDGAIASLLLLRRHLLGTEAPTPAHSLRLPSSLRLLPSIRTCSSPQNCGASQAQLLLCPPPSRPPFTSRSTRPCSRTGAGAAPACRRAPSSPVDPLGKQIGCPALPPHTTKVLTFLP